jgi:hypothetical protein
MLVVEFRDSGAVYAYAGVSAETYDALRTADSLGSYYNRQIKGQYDCQRIR